MSQALAKINNTQLSTLDDVMQLGEVFFKSGLFSDTKQAAQCVVKILAGQELGFAPIASMMNINIIQGKVSLGANMIAAKIQNSGKYDFRVREITSQKCSLEFFKGNESIGFSEFTMEEATKAQLNNKDNWKKHPKNMLFARAVSNGARWFTAELFNGAIYTPEEMGVEVDGETGAVISQTQTVATPLAFTGSQPVIEAPLITPASIREFAKTKNIDIDAKLEKQGKPTLDTLPQEALQKILSWVEQAPVVEATEPEEAPTRNWTTEIELIWTSIFSARVRGFNSRADCFKHLVTEALSRKWIDSASEIEAPGDLTPEQAEKYYSILVDLYEAAKEQAANPLY